MPRVKKQTDVADEPQRRSSRIATQSSPTTDANKKKKKSSTTTATKKKATTQIKTKKKKPATKTKKTVAKNGHDTNDDDDKKASSSKSTIEDQLQVGDFLPADLTLNDQDGNEIDIDALRNVVIFLYPKANTPGCTTQARCYRDQVDEFKEAGYEIYGLSDDSEAILKKWKTKESLPYTLISDPDRHLIRPLTGSGFKTIRSHVVINSKGKISDIKLKVKAAESADDALESVQGGK